MKCIIDWCQRERVTDAAYCRDHLNDLWAGRLPVREPEWLRRARERPNGLARDETGKVAA